MQQIVAWSAITAALSALFGAIGVGVGTRVNIRPERR
jgi:hypothetical protein